MQYCALLFYYIKTKKELFAHCKNWANISKKKIFKKNGRKHITALNIDRIDKEGRRATATSFDFAQGSLQAVRSRWETNKKAGLDFFYSIKYLLSQLSCSFPLSRVKRRRGGSLPFFICSISV